jgi:hypothetical protein
VWKLIALPGTGVITAVVDPAPCCVALPHDSFSTLLILILCTHVLAAAQLAELQRSAAAHSRKMMDAYFERIKRLSSNDKLESRLRFMLLDVVEQRLRGWETRRKKEGPKKIEVGCDVLSLTISIVYHGLDECGVGMGVLVCFMLLDVVEQRLRGWETRRKKEGPKKIEVAAGLEYCYLYVVGVSAGQLVAPGRV